MDTFCVLPWYGSFLGKIKNPCCFLPELNDNELQTLQQQLINNEKPVVCNKCWDSEKSGKTSKRDFENSNLSYLLNTDICTLFNNAKSNKASVLVYQVQASNLCNGACVTCCSALSTTWAKYERKMDITPMPKRITNDIAINYKTAKSIVFAGGEPLFDPTVFDILRQLIDNNNYDCFISFVTNGITKLSTAHKKLIQNFTNINFCISIDGTERVYEYIRYPGKWPDLLKNIKVLKEITHNINVSYTVSNLTVDSHDKTIKWFNANNLRYNINVVTWPKHFAPDVRPGHKEWNNFVSFIKKQDDAKSIHIKDFIPSIATIINNTDTNV